VHIGSQRIARKGQIGDPRNQVSQSVTEEEDGEFRELFTYERDGLLQGGQADFGIDRGRQQIGVRLEDLQHVHMWRLLAEVVGHGLGQMVQQLVHEGAVFVDGAAEAAAVLREAALDAVDSEREWGTGETKDRLVGAELAAQAAQDLSDGDVGVDAGGLEAVQIVDVAQRRIQHRAGPFFEVQVHAHQLEGNQNVVEDNGGVDVQRVDGLQRDLERKIDRASHLHEGVLLAQHLIAGQIATGLAHHPDRQAIHRLMPQGGAYTFASSHNQSSVSGP